MATPRKAEIIEKAKQMWFDDQLRQGFQPTTNPERSELQESGYLSLAMTELMQNDDKKYTEWVHNDILDVKDLVFDVELAKRRGTFISGSRGSGKSNLGKILADRLIKDGCIVKVFDNSQIWRHSNIPNLLVVKPDKHGKIDVQIDFYKSYVFDISHLYIKIQRLFTEFVIRTEFNYQANMTERKEHIYIFEECELLVGTHNRSEEIMRLVCVGRNFDLSYIALAQRLAMVSTSLISQCGQMYFGQAHEENDKKKLRNWLGSHTNELEDLSIGEFLYKNGKYVEKLRTPLFQRKVMEVRAE